MNTDHEISPTVRETVHAGSNGPIHDGDTVHGKARFWALTLGCIGVVYGDIGTSTLYAFREAVKHVAVNGVIDKNDVYGILSLILWTLVINVTLKYVLFLLRVDNNGEGGSLSLMALARRAVTGKRARIVFGLGMLGAALFYGEAAITPAISVLSAVEGLELVSPSFSRYVLPLSIVILVTLFSVQKFGTEKVSAFFGPMTAFWFLSTGLLGLSWIVRDPQVLVSINPYYAVHFLLSHGRLALVILGAAFLVVTGTEALYVDLSHFGRKPIQTAWLGLVFPCLFLNYLGQGAMVLAHPETYDNPFYLMAPEWLLVPLILMATMATIIASQAVITGAFSMAQQAIQFGLLPRMEIRHTSVRQEGQIYMPKINRILVITVLMLILIFKSSGALAAAYGLAVNGTMLVTSILAFIVVWRVWRKSPWIAAAIVLPFILVESVFFLSNILKLFEGGLVPLFIASVIILLMSTWVRGTKYLYTQAHRRTILLADLLKSFETDPPKRIQGTAIFLTSDPEVAPVAMMQNLKHNKVLHSLNIILTVVTTHTPRVGEKERLTIAYLSPSIVRMTMLFGYTETPNVPRALSMARHQGIDINLQDVSFFLGRRSIISSAEHRYDNDLFFAWQEGVVLPRRRFPFTRHKSLAHRGLPEWQDHIYIALAHASVTATDFYHIPRNRVVELGTQLAV